MAAHLDAWTPAFGDLVPEDAVLEHVAAGFALTEGPVWMGTYLLFSDIPRSRTVRWQMLPEGPEVRTFRTDTGGGNGLACDHMGRIICCEQAARRLTRVTPDGSVTALATHFNGKRLNSPNDVVVHSSGAIYFTDPPFGLPNGSEGKELTINPVFRLDPDGKLTPVVTDCDKPNGLCFSPDERTLYVADTPPMLVRAYDVQLDGTLTNGRVFADMTSTDLGRPDGMKVDSRGNLYCTGGGGVRILAPDGTRIGRIRTPEQGRNIAFGDDGLHMLYITAGSGLYRIRLTVAGHPPGTAPIVD